MYQVINNETGVLICETINPRWLRQQPLRDFPINANNFQEADGILIPDPTAEYGERMIGIINNYVEGKPNMLNYEPVARIVEVPDGAYLQSQIDRLQAQVNNVQITVDTVHAYQTEETVLRSELDAAYTQGVNAI